MTKQQQTAEPTDRIVIDAEELIEALQSHSELEYYLDRTTGEIEFLGEEDVVEEQTELRELVEQDESDRFVYIHPLQSSEGWQIMADFIEQLPFGKVRERLTRAVQHGKPFRRFKDELLNYPDIREGWFAFEHRRMLEHARDWLKDEDVEADLKTRDL